MSNIPDEGEEDWILPKEVYDSLSKTQKKRWNDLRKANSRKNYNNQNNEDNLPNQYGDRKSNNARNINEDENTSNNNDESQANNLHILNNDNLSDVQKDRIGNLLRNGNMFQVTNTPCIILNCKYQSTRPLI